MKFIIIPQDWSGSLEGMGWPRIPPVSLSGTCFMHENPNQKWKCWDGIEGLLLAYWKKFHMTEMNFSNCLQCWLLPDFLQVWTSCILLNLRTWIAILQKGCHYFYLFMFNSLHNIFIIILLQWIILKNHLSTC